MDSNNSDVEEEFPGLYAPSGNKNKKDDTELSDGDHERVSKKELLIGRKKDKKDKGYAALEGESSQEEEDPETKSPSKSKKVKAFKFPTKSKEKREKSREKLEPKEKEAVEVKDKTDKKKDKDKKDKEKKEKVKEKDKKEKKVKQGSINDEIFDLGDAQPIFGVSLGLSVERSKCHDNINLPLVVRDCIDYLQEFGLANEQIYKSDGVKARLQHFKKLYNNRESTGTEEFDVATASALLKMFLKELPEPILTTDLSTRFEEAAALSQVSQQEKALLELVDQLPGCNRTLLAWLILHLDEVTQHEKQNKMNAQGLAVILSPTLQMSHRLLVTILCHCSSLFSSTQLFKYIPPITAASPNLPETSDDITKELRKQESLLAQIHAEMNAGFVTKKREEQLWEVQRIITQLKRKLRSFEKKQDSMQKSIDDTVDGELSMELSVRKTKTSYSDEETSGKTATERSNTEAKLTPAETSDDNTVCEEKEVTHATSESSSASGKTNENVKSSAPQNEKLIIDENGILLLPEDHPEYMNLISLQLENQELSNWKIQLQAKINAERSELVRLKQQLNNEITLQQNTESSSLIYSDNNDIDYERLIANYIKENSLLEQKKSLLSNELFDENKSLINMTVALNLLKYRS